MSRGSDPTPQPRMISIIIPTLNERRTLPATMASIPDTEQVEVIVVDGGSVDGTRALARERARVIGSPAGRGTQMNVGAAAARGGVLLFLHADSALPPEALAVIDSALSLPEVVGGAFRLSIATDQPLLRLLARVVNLRSTLIGMPYGDQAIFVRRTAFAQVGGYEAWPLMEDVDLVRKLRRRGRIAILDAAVTTSARRWTANGVWRTTITNWVALGLYRCGVGTDRIRRFYDRMLVKEPAATIVRRA